MTQQVNRLTAVFNEAMQRAMASENKDDWMSHLITLSNTFIQVCTLANIEESYKVLAIKERDLAAEELIELKSKAIAHDDVIQQFHVLLAADNQRNHTDLTSQLIFDKMCEEVRGNMAKIQDYSMIEARYNDEKRRNDRMIMHINELSRKNIMHLMASRFYARELAAMRQLLNLIHKAPTIEASVKSKLWSLIDKENQILRLNTLWLVNRINSRNQEDAAFEDGDNWQSPPRIVILGRDHINQGLGLEITGGYEHFRPIVVTGKLKRSMADTDELLLNDRILAIDGTFVTNSTTHAEALELLANESSKEFIALLVSQFNPDKYQMAHPRFQIRRATSSSTTEEEED